MNALFTLAMFLLIGRTSVVEVGEIKSAVFHFVISRLDSTFRNDAVVEFRGGLNRVSIASPEHTIRVGSDHLPVFRGYVSVPVEIDGGGRIQRQMIVSVKVRLFGQVYVAKHQLERHENLTEDDVTRRLVEITFLPDDIVLRQDQLTGRRSSRMIAEGGLLRESSLELIPLVFRDERVTLLVKAGNVLVSSSGIAKEDGVFGSTIEVQKVDSHERIRAVVVDDHTVEVTME